MTQKDNVDVEDKEIISAEMSSRLKELLIESIVRRREWNRKIYEKEGRLLVEKQEQVELLEGVGYSEDGSNTSCWLC